jgi:hypothetical protein
MIDRFYSAQDGHHVQLIAPKDITGGASSPAFACKLYSHVSIVLAIGASAAAFTSIVLEQCTDAAGDGAIAIPFDLFAAETPNVDVLGPRLPQTAAGYVPSANDDIFYVIEIDSSQLTQGFDYLKLVLANGVNSVIAHAHAILSGARYGGDQSPTVLA